MINNKSFISHYKQPAVSGNREYQTGLPHSLLETVFVERQVTITAELQHLQQE